MIKTDIGEYIVGAYLNMKEECTLVDYNVRPHGGGLKGLEELDVMGINLTTKTVYLCEVTTHIRGLLYVDNKTTVEKIIQKHQRQKDYFQDHIKKYFTDFKCIYMLWSPVVPIGYLTEELNKIQTLQLVINKEYTERINELKTLAKKSTNDTGNPFFRMLQILEHLK